MYVSASMDLYSVCMELMHATCMWGIHIVHWSAAMCQRNKTQLVVYQKAHNGVEEYTKEYGSVYDGHSISDYNQISREVTDSISTLHHPYQDTALISIKPYFLPVVSSQSGVTWDWSCVVIFFLLIRLQVTSLPSDVAWMLMRLKLSNSFGALCLCLTPKASHYAHFVACLL